MMLPENGETMLKGWLNKKGEGRLVGFSKRWFAQIEDKIYYYKDDKDKEPQGYIDLTTYYLGTNL